MTHPIDGASRNVASTERFSNRVTDYVRSRPGYPLELAGWLCDVAKLTPHSVVADVGSGTGISTNLFLGLGCRVYAVEPNDAMRQAAESRLVGQPGFRSVAGTAEATTLEDGVVDLVVAGQAFHWFDVDAVRREFSRVLRPGGLVAVFWNVRREVGDPFLEGYEALLRAHGTDYLKVRHQADPNRIDALFGGPYEQQAFPNDQVLDYGGLRGRLLSSSYVPAESDPGHGLMLDALRQLFDTHQEGGSVRLTYDTKVYVGRIQMKRRNDMSQVVGSIRAEFLRYKALAEGALRQVSDAELSLAGPEASNSLATICWHISGNLESRFTDFLTTDGEKPSRHRDEEFESRGVTHAELDAKWARGWDALLQALSEIDDSQLERTVTIRGQEMQVSQALLRALAHISYHVGQVVYVAKAIRGGGWSYLSIPPGQSNAYNQAPRMELPDDHAAAIEQGKPQ